MYRELTFGFPPKTYIRLDDESQVYENTMLFECSDKEGLLAIAYEHDVLIMTFGYRNESEYRGQK